MGGRPKIKAAPEEKVKIGKIVAASHGPYICRIDKWLSSKKLGMVARI
jgi:hypothetical protein